MRPSELFQQCRGRGGFLPAAPQAPSLFPTSPRLGARITSCPRGPVGDAPVLCGVPTTSFIWAAEKWQKRTGLCGGIFAALFLLRVSCIQEWCPQGAPARTTNHSLSCLHGTRRDQTTDSLKEIDPVRKEELHAHPRSGTHTASDTALHVSEPRLRLVHGHTRSCGPFPRRTARDDLSLDACAHGVLFAPRPRAEDLQRTPA